VISELPEDVKLSRSKDKKEQFFDMLPEKFTYQEFVEMAKSLNIRPRTAERYIALFCEKELINRDQLGSYTNLTHLNNKDEQ
jgi:hypothetical protein